LSNSRLEKSPLQTDIPVEGPVFRSGKIVLNRRHTLWVMLAYLVALALASYFSFSLNAVVGVIFFIGILFCLILLAALSGSQEHRNVWIVLGLAPFIRIISLALPVMLEISQFVWYIVISIPILFAVFGIVRTLKYSPDEIGINLKEASLQFLVAAGGIFIGIFGYYFLRNPAWTFSFSLQNTFFPALVLLIFTGFVEELVFRGVMQKALESLGPNWWIFGAVVYAVLQFGQGSLNNCLFSLVLSLYLGYMVKSTGSILGASLAHGMVNIGIYLVLPYILIF
jgi:uncharacterized protein